ncbi:alpha/beta hydrolase [Segatella sp.]|uniref:alpha/beta hydrolase n=1 Tax=Segatella sp. TaxID=2974253 RepID=UPI003A8E3821
MKKVLWMIFMTFMVLNVNAQKSISSDEVITSNIQYKNGKDTYIKERCKLDICYDKSKKNSPVVVWYHGGGLTSGQKEIPGLLKKQGFVVVGVNYRLLPKVKIDECLDDCAAALAWVFQNISQYGGDAKKIFVSGHSAGGYITTMLGLDKTWLSRYGVDANNIAGLIPFSGQMISHFAYRKMNGIDNLQPTIDKYAPLYHVRKDVAPLVLITGDRNIELFGRYEENAYMWRMMNLIGRPDTQLYELGGYGHGAMAQPAFHILIQTIHKMLGEKYNF